MAPPTSSTDLADQLVASLLPQEVSATKLRKQTDIFSRKLRTHTYGRTNQFDVAERLEGLQEAFQILNNDELTDALQNRLVKLKRHSEKWLPDILDLLLRLSDDPASKTKIEWLADIGTFPAIIPSLTWAEIEAEEPLHYKDQIWKVAEYSDLSSDEDLDAEVPTTLIPNAAIPIDEKQDAFSETELEPLNPEIGPEVVERLRGDQFWNNVSNESFGLTEVQVIREVVFMLHGLPTALFWKVGNAFEIDQRFRLNNTSREIFVESLSDLSQIAIRLDMIRDFVKKAQSKPFMQTLRSLIEERLQEIDSQLCVLEQDILTERCEAAATVLQTLARVSEIMEVTRSLAALVDSIHPPSIDDVKRLEVLFDQVCQTQANGDDSGFQCLSRLFLRSFQTYLRPLRDWMDEGTLEEDPGTNFVTARSLDQDMSLLWQKWYILADDSGAQRCPKFLQPFKNQIFNIGKTVVFLQLLNAPIEISETPLIFIPQEPYYNENSLLPFSELLASFVQDFIGSRLQNGMVALRDRLGNNCGLWKSLDALENVFFGKNGQITELIDTKVFTTIDRCERNWSDRFLLGDLLQTAFEPVESIEAEKLSLKPPPHPSRNMPHRRQSVKLLKDLRFQYRLHWSIANIITTSSLASYQRISTFLTQIRRARYMLERRSLSQVRMGGSPDTNPHQRNLTQLLHHALLLFLNTLYSHLTTLVIESANASLRRDLSNAPDIDAMINAHNTYSRELEEACLTAKKLQPIHNAIIAILDLCIRFSDLNTPTKSHDASASDADADADVHSYVSATSHQRRRRRRHRHRQRGQKEDSSSASEDEDEENEEEEDDDDDDDGEGYSTFIVPEESRLLEQLRKLRSEFERNRSFVVAGLGSIARVGDQGRYWEILSCRLDWGKNTGAG